MRDHALAARLRAPRSSSSPTSCARSARSPTGSRSSAAARSSARPSPTRPTRRARLADGRPRRSQLTVDKEPAEPGRRRSSTVDGPHGRRRPGRSSGRRRVSFEVRARRDLRARRRAGQRADRADRGAARARARRLAGTITLEGQDVTHAGDRRRCSTLGVGYVPEDRLHDGLVGGFTVAENLVLDLYDRAPFARGMSLDLDGDRARTPTSGSRSSTSARQSVEQPGGHAVRRQPAEGRAGPRAVPAAQAAHRGPADARPRRRLDRVRAPADRRRARPRQPRSCVVSTELDEVLGAGRPDRA